MQILQSVLSKWGITANRMVDMDRVHPAAARSPDDVFGRRLDSSPSRKRMRRLPAVSLRLPVIILVFAAALIFIPLHSGTHSAACLRPRGRR